MMIVMSLLFGAGSSALISISFQNSLRQEKQAAQASYRMILNTLQVVNRMDEWTEEEDISKILEQLSSQGTFWAALKLRSKDAVLYSDGTAAADFIDLAGQIDNTHLASTFFSTSETAHYFQLSGCFSVGKSVFYLDVAHDISSIYQSRLQQQNAYQRIFTILLAACAFFSYILAFFLTRPLAKLSRASREIASGNYDYRINLKSHDEISAVSKDFDLMAEHLQASIREFQNSIERQNLFVENFTHELKTPMTSIIGYADLIRSQPLPKEDLSDAANYIFSEGRRLERLSLKLLEIFVSEHGKLSFTKTSAAETTQSLVSHLTPQLAKEQISLQCECEPGCCMLDTDFFSSLLVNLIENARKAMPDGGKIFIQTAMTDTGCRVIVRDTGKGIPAEALAHITEAFYRVDKARSRTYGGAGLGLTLCAKIAELHNGSISFESSPENGTTVTVTLNGGRA